MKFESKINLIFQLLVGLIYVLLMGVCMNHCFFWDNIQQISKEAHWFYLTDFHQLLMPVHNTHSVIVATGYHPPLMGIMTAFLWKVLGYKLWVSHVFIFCWALILIVNVWKVVKRLFPENIAGWVLLVTLLESTLLTQYSISSPDFILFTAFILSLRAVLENKPFLLSIGVFFLCCINMRGIFVGGILFLTHFYFIYLQTSAKPDFRTIIRIILPYLPTFILLAAYFTYFFSVNGWFFSNTTENIHYSLPGGIGRILKHLAEFILRSVENGRIIIWIIGCYVAFIFVKRKTKGSPEFKTLLFFFLLLTGLYIIFVFITQMPFSSRYFMPQFFLLTLLAFMGLSTLLNKNNLKIALVVVLCFELTGNLWIYPDKIAKSWDCTLAHLPFYELRKECFNYIDQQKLDYHQISAGFCLYGNRGFIELKNEGKIIGTETNNKYFIDSNISNVEDTFAADLKNKQHWVPVKTFKKFPVYITIYRNVLYNATMKQ
jgi:4-amino-4-deoxy-L-arabinose transferase-like glycosyltransferase